jgi:hypothetical protein
MEKNGFLKCWKPQKASLLLSTFKNLLLLKGSIRIYMSLNILG